MDDNLAAPVLEVPPPVAPSAPPDAIVIEPAPALRPGVVHLGQQRPRRFKPLVAAGVLGLALFAVMSGFGRDVRRAEPLAAQFDQVLRSAGFAINEVTISGHKLALDSEIYEALKIDSDSSILGFDVIAARRRVENIAWIKEAQVVRVLPDKLRVQVTERKPIALWRQGEQQALVDATGRILAKVAKGSAPNLPVITGAGAPEAAAELLSALELHPALGERIETATRVGQRRWSLALADGTIVHLPEASARDALRRLSDLDRQAGLLKRPAQVIDLRKHGLIAVGPPTRRAAADRLEAQPEKRPANRQAVE